MSVPAVADTLIINADDFGLCDGVNKGILSLLEKGRINATSAMVTSPYFAHASAGLKEHCNSADIGLHFTLTQLPTVTEHIGFDAAHTDGIGGVMAALAEKRLTYSAVRQELVAQIDRFEKHIGCGPAFVDGHHHIQQLPVIRNVILDVLVNRYKDAGSRPYIKCAFESPANVIKRGIQPLRAFFIGLGGLGLHTKARASSVPVNDSFTGIYDYSDKVPFGTCFEKFASVVRGNTVLMCHPGFNDEALVALGGFGPQRKAEYDFLAGGEVVDVLGRLGVVCGRFVRPAT